MSDEKFEEFLQREAKAYNAPPSAPPRDAMWQAIAAARAASHAPRQGGAAPSDGTHILPRASRKPRLRYAPWIGMAATLLIGVGIGRYALQRGVDPTGPAPVASATIDAPGAGLRTDPTSAVGSADAGGETTFDAPGTTTETSPDAARAPRRLTAQRNTPTRLASASADPEPIEMATSPEQVASREHMQRAEALISVVAAAPSDAMMDSLTGRWAREMLTNTRLLLDSPAGDDASRRRLLEDLETLLVQLVQRSGGAVDERYLIDRTLERTQLLTRLRTSAAGI